MTGYSDSMDIALHLGAHLTDDDHLVRCLMRNRSALSAQGIAVPGPGSYRRQLRELAHEMREHPVDAGTQEVLLDGLVERDDVRRVVLSNENFVGFHRWAIGGNRFYPSAGTLLAQLVRLFPMARTHAYLAIRNPATFLPALAADSRSGGVDQVLQGVDPLALRWSDLIVRIRDAVPSMPLTVWRDEDTPLLWPEILRAVSGHDPGTELEGWFAWYWTLMTPKAHEAMRRWFAANPPVDDLHRRRVLGTMLDRFALPEKVVSEITLPGWDATLTETLSDLYEQDADLIGALPGVTLLEP